MIAFIIRFFILMMVFATFALNIFVFLLGQPQEETWRFYGKAVSIQYRLSL